MKTKSLLITLCLILCIVSISFAQDQDVRWHNANQVSLKWDAVTTDADGDAITGVTYELLLANVFTDPNKSNPVVVYEGDATQTTITIAKKGMYFVGVRAVLGEDKSEINWADVAENQESVELIGIRFAVPPKTPKNLQKN